VLLGPPTLARDRGLPHGMLTAVLSGRSLVCMVLIGGIIKFKFAILRSGATINDGGKSERSNAMAYHQVPCNKLLI